MVLIIIILSISQICVCGAVLYLHQTIVSMLKDMKTQDDINHVSFQSSQVLADRIDAVSLIAEDAIKKYDIAELQISNLNNKASLHSTAIRKLQNSCLEVK